MSQKHSATLPTPPTAPLRSNAQEQVKTTAQQTADLNALFMGMALEMSWQLAIVVIVPIVGGYLLDGRLHTSPWLTLLGLIIACIGVIGVLKRVLSEANRRSGSIHTPKDTV